eukprot:sb/3478162/
MFMVSGISTLLQVFFGTRLPIIQSGSYVYFAVAAGIMSNYPCEDSYVTAYPPIQFVFGGFGLAGLLLKIIGPITITIVISVIGLSLIDVAIDSSSQNWGISLG